jgi:hypothetical protein
MKHPENVWYAKAAKPDGGWMSKEEKHVLG